jgi:hypothetical protein
MRPPGDCASWDTAKIAIRATPAGFTVAVRIREKPATGNTEKWNQDDPR